MNHVERVLAAVASHRQPTAFAGASLLFLQQLVTLDLLRSRDELRMRRRVRRGLLRDVLAGDGTPDELRIRLQAQGFDEASVVRVVIVEPQSPPAEPGRGPGTRAGGRLGGKLLRSLDDVLSQRRIPFLSSSHGLARGGVSPSCPTAARRRRAPCWAICSRRRPRPPLPPAVAVGCSAPLAGVASAAQGSAAGQGRLHRRPPRAASRRLRHLRRAERALPAARRARRDDSLGDLVHRTFAPLLDYDARHHANLYETLRTLFEHRLAVQETADALHIHRNTLQKRLAHVERLLAIDLSDLDVIVDIRLGLHAAELLGGPLP